jgi:predicted ATP-dependent endonuclease of OLD family
MTVTVSALEVRNFRSCRETSLVLSAYTPIVGRNNCGKSNIIEGLKWLVRKYALKEKDFNDVDASVEVTGTLVGISDDDIKILKEPKHQKAIAKYVKDGKLHIRRVQQSPKAALKDIDLLVLDPTSGSWEDNPAGIDGALAALFPEPIHIGAMEDAAEDASIARTSTTIGKLLNALLETIRQRHADDLKVHLGALSARISAKGGDRIAELAHIDASINAKVKDLFPGVSIRLDFPVPDLEDLIKAGTVLAYEDEEPEKAGRAFGSLGHGSQRAVQMALVRYLAELRRGEAAHGGAHLLLIDEPELYLHPSAIEHIREALKILATSGYQVVLTTHSAQMITPSDAPSTILAAKKAGQGTWVRPRLTDALEKVVPGAEHQIGLLFTLTHAAHVFFADTVVLAEGKTELRLLPYLFKQVSGRTLGQAGMALVAQSGVNDTRKSMDVLSVMGIPAKAIVDLDFAFRASVHGFLAHDDEDVLACKAIFQALHAVPSADFKLDSQGLPAKGGTIRPADAFELLARHADAGKPIQNLAKKLAAQSIWIWKSGAIEAPLGLKAKKEAHWRQFQQLCEERGLDGAAPDSAAIRELVKWLTDQAASPQK